jgi:YbbR domain-containing protein
MNLNPFTNLGLKALSLAIAVILWYGVSRDSVVERSIRVPVEFQNTPDGLQIVGDAPGSVDVRVRGASSLLSRIETGDVVAVLDMHTARPGQRMFHVLTDEVRVPAGMEITQVNPPTITVQLERTGTRSVRVVPAVEGKPAEGYVVEGISSDPDHVEIVGPESRLRLIDEAITEPVSVANATRPVTDRVTVGVVDGMLRLKTPTTAAVVVNVLPAPIERTLGGVRVQFRNVPVGRAARTRPDTVSVVLRGQREYLARVAPADVSVYVDLSSLGPGRYVLPVKPDASDQLRVVRTDPATVQVNIR